MRDLGRLVVADDRRQRRDQHQRPVNVLGDPRGVKRRALHAEDPERPARPRASSVAECRKLAMITGRIVFSSRIPDEAATLDLQPLIFRLLCKLLCAICVRIG